MRFRVGALLLANLSIPGTAGGLSAQTPQTVTTAAGILREEPGAGLPPVPLTNVCDPAAPAVLLVSDTTSAPILPVTSLATASQVHFCSPAALGQVEDDGGEWYGRRLTLHRYSAWAAVAAFPVEIYTGWRLRTGGPDPEWVRDTHRATFWVLGGTFAVNTVTGVWNWSDSRKEPEGRGWRNAHTLVMLAADVAMFATARAGQARARGEGGEWHRELAFTTAGLTAAGHLMMLGPFRRD